MVVGAPGGRTLFTLTSLVLRSRKNQIEELMNVGHLQRSPVNDNRSASRTPNEVFQRTQVFP
jgi:hypothetical protein